MQKYVIAAAFVLALATPAFAAQFYVALDSSTKQCHVMAEKPDGATMKKVGSGAYKSEADAESAIQSSPSARAKLGLTQIGRPAAALGARSTSRLKAPQTATSPRALRRSYFIGWERLE